MDPSYSVLVGEPECNYLKSDNNSVVLAVAIAVPIVVVAIIAIISAVYFYPKAKLWMRIRSERRNVGSNLGSGSESGGGSEMREVNIEKMGKMEVNTVAGNYSVQF